MATAEMAESVKEYESALDELNFNSKPHINLLTLLADEGRASAADIVKLIEARIQQVENNQKLPLLYLIDSILKNCTDSPYKELFARNIVSNFVHVFVKVRGDEKTRQALFRLRGTWVSIFPASKLYAIDIKVHGIDPAWPLTDPSKLNSAAASSSNIHSTAATTMTKPATSIHVNPKFLANKSPSIPTKTVNLTSDDDEEEEEDIEEPREKSKEPSAAPATVVQDPRQKTLQLLQRQKMQLETTQRMNHKDNVVSKPQSTVRPVSSTLLNAISSRQAPSSNKDPRLRTVVLSSQDLVNLNLKDPSLLDGAPIASNSSNIRKRTSPVDDNFNSPNFMVTSSSNAGTSKVSRAPASSSNNNNNSGAHAQFKQTSSSIQQSSANNKNSSLNPAGAKINDNIAVSSKDISKSTSSNINNNSNGKSITNKRPGTHRSVAIATVGPIKKQQLQQHSPINEQMTSSDVQSQHVSSANRNKRRSSSPKIGSVVVKVTKEQLKEKDDDHVILIDSPSPPKVKKPSSAPQGSKVTARIEPGKWKLKREDSSSTSSSINRQQSSPADDRLQEQQQQPIKKGGGVSKKPSSHPASNENRAAKNSRGGGGPSSSRSAPSSLPRIPKLSPKTPPSGGNSKKRPAPSSFTTSSSSTAAPSIGDIDERLILIGQNQQQQQRGDVDFRMHQQQQQYQPRAQHLPFKKRKRSRDDDVIAIGEGGGRAPSPPASSGKPNVQKPEYKATNVIPDPIPSSNCVFVDGEAYAVRYIEDHAVIDRDGLPHRVRFVGTGREVTIDDIKYFLRFDEIKEVMIDGQLHQIRFGGPSRELYMGDYPFRGSFGGPPIYATINGIKHKLQLAGPAPEVKIEPEPAYELTQYRPKPILPHPPVPVPQQSLSIPVPQSSLAVPYQQPLPQPPQQQLHHPIHTGYTIPGPHTAGPSVGLTMPPASFFEMNTSVPPPPPPYKRQPLLQVPPGASPISAIGSGASIAPPVTIGGPLLIGQQQQHYMQPPSLPSLVPSSIMTSSSSMSVQPPAPNFSIQPPVLATGMSHSVAMVTPSTSTSVPAVAPPSGGMYPYNIPPQPSASMVAPPIGVQPALQAPPAAASAQPSPPVNVNDLLNKLVSTGMIGLQQDKAQSQQQQRQHQPASQGPSSNPPPTRASPSPPVVVVTSSAPRSVDVVRDTTVKRLKEPSPALQGLDMQGLKIRYTSVINALYEARNTQCTTCGMRFLDKDQQKYSRHLDWHFKQNRSEKVPGRVQSRVWYFASEDWIHYEEFGDDKMPKARSAIFDQAAQKKASDEPKKFILASTNSVIPATNDDHNTCSVCGEKFEQFWDEDDETWKLRNAALFNDKAYHPLCYQDTSHNSDPQVSNNDSSSIKNEMDDTDDVKIL